MTGKRMRWDLAAKRGRDATRIKDEADRLQRDAAAQWLERHDCELQRHLRKRAARRRAAR